MNRDDRNPEHDRNPDAQSESEQEITKVEDVVERIDGAADKSETVSLGDVADSLGHGSFVPLLLVAGLIMVAPVIGDIPGVPTIMGILVILVAGQIFFRREQLWLPEWLRKQTVSSSKVQKTLGWMRRPAKFMDRWTKQRYVMFVRHASVSVIAVVCILIAAATPLMEVVPMSANVAGAAITAFALALLASDGLLAIGAMILSAVAAGLMVYQFI